MRAESADLPASDSDPDADSQLYSDFHLNSYSELDSDPDLAARSGQRRRPAVDVAVGLLLDTEGRFLMTSRPDGKVYAGYWEFPGGKLEAGESVQAALVRELDEELGIHATAIAPWRVELVDYPHARVRLHFCKVTAWTGEFVMREGQQLAWQSLAVLPAVTVTPVLPGALPALAWLQTDHAASSG